MIWPKCVETIDPEARANALHWTRNGYEARTFANGIAGWGSSLVRGVGRAGLEPVTDGL